MDRSGGDVCYGCWCCAGSKCHTCFHCQEGQGSGVMGGPVGVVLKVLEFLTNGNFFGTDFNHFKL